MGLGSLWSLWASCTQRIFFNHADYLNYGFLNTGGALSSIILSIERAPPLRKFPYIQVSCSLPYFDPRCFHCFMCVYIYIYIYIKCTMKEEGRQHKKAGINSVFCAFYFHFSAD